MYKACIAHFHQYLTSAYMQLQTNVIQWARCAAYMQLQTNVIQWARCWIHSLPPQQTPSGLYGSSAYPGHHLQRASSFAQPLGPAHFYTLHSVYVSYINPPSYYRTRVQPPWWQKAPQMVLSSAKHLEVPPERTVARSPTPGSRTRLHTGDVALRSNHCDYLVVQ